ncbi:MAG: aminotransferase class I/II-fold pyridoxal phosphate-dependent enzyme [Acidobacteriota bacterium]|jgi:aminotransferase|nr:aminotransferase class I/II-fold pyridoxal phosphate-dependent enzyme [Acidobacteriota bacterium]
MTATYKRFIAERIHKIPVSSIRKFFGIAEKMPDVISLCIGEPDFPTPAPIAKFAFDSVYEKPIGYTANSGLIELRTKLSEHLEKLYGVLYDADNEIIITVGVSEAVKCVFTAICNKDDEIIIPEPCFVSYQPEVLFADGIPVSVECLAENDFEPLAEQIEAKITDKTKAIFLGFPNNPTGAVLTRKNALAIAELAVKNDLLIISDEIYDRLVYGTEHICMSALPDMKDRTVLLGGFSKDYAMPGWRVGYMCANPELMAAFSKVHQYAIMSAPTISQYAAIAALEIGEPFVQEMHEKYNRRRQFLVASLNEMGLDCLEPKGAFYAFPNVEKTGMNGDEFAAKLLTEKKVAVVPGSGFGKAGKNHVRIAYCKSYEEIEIALERMREFMNGI